MKSAKLTREGLDALRDRMAKEKALGRGRAVARVTVHMGTCGIASGAEAVHVAFAEEVEASGRKDVHLTTSGCIGFCSEEPLVTVERADEMAVVYARVDKEGARRIFWGHVLGGRIQHGLALARGRAIDERPPEPVVARETPLRRVDQIPFFGLQKSIVLRNKGLIDPEVIEEYIWRDGYQAAAKALLDMKPADIIAEVKASGLRGRGGAGFPTGLKWQFCASSKGDVKYVLCNADEGDPGAFMDRAVLEGDPHSVLEGMIVAARALDAHEGYIYCRAEYPLAVRRLEIAIEQAKTRGLLGKDILGSGFDLEISVYQGAGAFVCGEETALMASIEGRRGTPRPRPPFPAVSGLWGKPSVLNNVETYANIAPIILGGGEAYAKTGTEGSKGTKVFALTGKVRNVGLVEVPMGTSLGEIIFDVGGGIPGGKKFKAVQLGGPSGGCVPAQHLNTPTDYEAIAQVGAIMGSGGMIVVDQDTCMVDMARFFMDFCQDESCGKCTPCRVGTKRMLQILERICAGEGREGDVELLEDLAVGIKDSALCGLGQTAPNPVLSTIRFFRHEYDAHIREKHCEASVCNGLYLSPCQHACPAGMDIPAYIALVRAGRIDDAFTVLKRTNPFPSTCGRVCGHPCQLKCRRGDLDEPLAVMHLKRFIADTASRPDVEPLPVTRQERVAVVGAGPSGLTAALELRKRGYRVTVYEGMPEPGGMLRYGIPPYRLPREELDRDVNEILATGVDLRTNVRLGRDITISGLEQEFDAIYVAIGAHKNAAMGVPGEDAEGVLGAAEFLKAFNLGKPMEIGKRVAVIGGGNSAADAARSAIRMGAESVAVYYRRNQEDMPALGWEVDAALEEGVRIECLVAPVRIVSEDGRVVRLDLTRIGLGKFDSSARRRPEPVPGSEFSVKVDTVIAAVGHKVDVGILAGVLDVQGAEVVRVDEGQRTSHPKIWAGGDAATGPAMVIDAIRAGRKAAESIDGALRAAKGEDPWVPVPDGVEVPFEVDEQVVSRPQVPVAVLRPSERRRDFREVELGYTLEQAMAEARRCLRCDGGKAGVDPATKGGAR